MSTTPAPRPRIRMPRQARAGEVIQISTLVQHVMESGQRKDEAGNTVPRNIVNRFTCTFEGQPVVEVDLEPGISANPFFRFTARVDRSGTFRFTWVTDDGITVTHEERITVT